MWSGGMDSTLLLSMLREQPIEFDIVTHRGWWSRSQREWIDALIKKWNLRVFDFPPSAASLIGDGQDVSIVQEFAFGLPLVADIIEGDRCLSELEGKRLTYAPMTWETVIVGSRSEDEHYAGRPVTKEKWKVGNTTYWAPLFNWTREMVIEESKKRGLDTTGFSSDLSFCTKCLHHKEVFCPLEGKVIPPVQWDGKANLNRFQAAYGQPMDV